MEKPFNLVDDFQFYNFGKNACPCNSFVISNYDNAKWDTV